MLDDGDAREGVLSFVQAQQTADPGSGAVAQGLGSGGTGMDRRLGKIEQIGYVVADIEAACRAWADTQGVGPWLLSRDLEFSGTYDGQPTSPRLHVALAYHGDVQVELIQQLDDGPSPYRAYLPPGGSGIHHVGYCIEDDVGARIEQARAQGLDLRLDIRGHGGMRFAYLSLPAMAPVFVELIETPRWLRGTFDQLRAAAATWEGGSPFLGAPD